MLAWCVQAWKYVAYNATRDKYHVRRQRCPQVVHGIFDDVEQAAGAIHIFILC